jgi:hypothetical protein
MPQFEAILKDIHIGDQTLNIFGVLSDKTPKKACQASCGREEVRDLHPEMLPHC